MNYLANMNVFEIFDLSGNRVVEGHKVLNSAPLYDLISLLQASFCLEDNDCQNVEEKYKCDNYGDQVGHKILITYHWTFHILGDQCWLQGYLLLQH